MPCFINIETLITKKPTLQKDNFYSAAEITSDASLHVINICVNGKFTITLTFSSEASTSIYMIFFFEVFLKVVGMMCIPCPFRVQVLTKKIFVPHTKKTLTNNTQINKKTQTIGY